MNTNLDKLLIQIDDTEKLLGDSTFDINKFLLPDSEVVKNLILLRSPGMSNEDADIMVYGLNNNNNKSFIELDKLSNEVDTDYKKNEVNGIVSKTKKQLETPIIKENDSYYQEAKNIKLNLKEKSSDFVRKIKELLEEVSIGGITLSQSIPGAIGLLMPYGFNVPGMITMIMNILLTLKSIKSKSIDVRNIFIHFKDIKIACSTKDANIVAGVLNGLFKTLNDVILSFIQKIEDFIKTILSIFKTQMSSENEGKRIKKTSRKLRKLKYLPNNNMEDVDEDDQDEVETILSDWEVINKNSKTNALRRKQESKQKIDSALADLEKLSNINNELKNLITIEEDPEVSTIEENLYDVELPNGQILYALTREQIENLKPIYVIKYV
jgi:hypothetical protein